MSTTAKVICWNKVDTGEGEKRQALVQFQPDYAEGRNAEWAAATPHLALSMTVNGAVAGLFDVGARYTLTFTLEDDG